MTTVAYRDGILAADSRGTCSGWIQPGRETKLFRLIDGRAAGVTGQWAIAAKLLKWIESDRSESQPEGDARVVVIGKKIEVFEDGHSYIEAAKFMAWGSGMPPALGALHAGASAVEAVRIAGLVDTLTGGRVISMQCEI
ncbi:hypothetical protein LB542_19725 [Mesorhizobium sp. BR1-1-9]|uniref:hypothetical protein n=1 Tax=Mesorhizobium sp. BR1-1-9 TaxID=2876646 RepID=UPI001CD05695|nr:hypothetical protein [Mesorhizobium sp. BR1-1-9]MBZ9873080.1 hypothetical protein [Mesorhizobium sp. BR1-1-9]